MKRLNWDKIIETVVWISLFGIVLCLSLRTCSCHGAEISLLHGSEISWSSSFQEESIDHSSVLFELQISEYSPWYDSLVIERIQSKVKPSYIPRMIDGRPREGSYSSLSVGYRIGLRYQWGVFLFSGFGGFSWMHEHQPEIENSGITGHFGASMDICILKDTLFLEYALIHTSDPLHDNDSGHERQYVGLRWRF